MALSVLSYNAAERRAMEGQPNRIIEACRPELFLKAGYPVEVASERGLVRFLDVMHENRDAVDYKELLAGFTRDEFDIYKEISRKVTEFSGDRFGKRIVPKGALIRAMLSYRHIRMLVEPGACIFEVGPGSGYLGALLATCGYRYAATDITQGFYLYQNHLWDYLFGSRLLELADSDQAFIGFGELPERCILHVPWWKYTITEAAQIDTPIDLYVANHALCEMNLYSMRYTMALANQLLSKSSKHGFFFVEGTGGEMLRSRAATLHYFTSAKFARVFEDGGLIDVLMPLTRIKNAIAAPNWQPSVQKVVASPAAIGAITRIRRGVRNVRGTVHRNGGFARAGIKAMRHFLGSSRNRRAATSLTQPPQQTALPDPSETHIHRHILKERESIRQQAKVPLEELRAFQIGLVSGEDILSDDERFFQYVFGADFYS